MRIFLVNFTIFEKKKILIFNKKIFFFTKVVKFTRKIRKRLNKKNQISDFSDFYFSSYGHFFYGSSPCYCKYTNYILVFTFNIFSTFASWKCIHERLVFGLVKEWTQKQYRFEFIHRWHHMTSYMASYLHPIWHPIYILFGILFTSYLTSY